MTTLDRVILYRNKSQIILLSLVVTIIFLSTSFAAQTSFGFRLGDADPMLNNIWLEPKEPEPGDLISINSSVYNLGTQSTKSVTDVVTVGYFINGELVKIDELPDILPGIEGGVKMTTGPIWKAIDGTHTITVILNYHDTLSHLTDNLENNIMQKTYHIGEWQNPPSLISFELFQELIPDTEKQIIKIKGNIDLPENFPEYRTPRINIELTDEKNSITKYSIIIDRNTDSFYWRETVPVSHMVIPITVYFSDERYQNSLYTSTANLYPVDLEQGESLLTLRLDDPIESYNFKNQNFVVAIYDESYKLIKKDETSQILDYPIKKVETIQLPASPFKKDELPPNPNPILSINPSGDLLYVILPGDKTYNFEIYSENQLEYSSIKFLKENKILSDIIKVGENSYPVNLKQNESLLSLKLYDQTNSKTFENSNFTIVLFQDSYNNLFKEISTHEYDELSSINDGDFLTLLPSNHEYIAEVYLDGVFLTAFTTFLENNSVTTKDIFILEPDQLQFKTEDELGDDN